MAKADLEPGTPPNRAAFLARHPDVAEELAECLSGLDFVNAVAPALSGDAQATAAAVDAGAGVEPGTPLGDFRIIRQVGRGGMGIVYEAGGERCGPTLPRTSHGRGQPRRRNRTSSRCVVVASLGWVATP
jgi:hypothetical protein